MTFRDETAAATAVGTLLAPVVACLRGDREALDLLLDAALAEGRLPAAVDAAPSIARTYLRLAPPPDGAAHILDAYRDAAYERFGDDGIVTVGAECLQVARVAAPLRPLAQAVFVQEALTHGDRCALEGLVASCWWCALESAQMRGVDPIEEAVAVCRYVARVA